MRRTTPLLALTTALTTLAGAAAAQSQGDMTLGFGLGWVNPKSDNGTLAGAQADIGDDFRPILTFEYFIRDNLGIELLAATPFEHDVALGGANIGTVKHLPPVLSLNYHFPTQTRFKPFLGIGVNYTTFFEESTPLGNLELEDSWGIALQAGADYQLSDQGSLRLSVRWMDIDSDATLNGAPIGTAEIDPLVVGVSYVWKF